MSKTMTKMTKNDATTTSEAGQSIDELRDRFERLNTRKIQTEANRDSAIKQLRELQAEAKEQYGTADVDELKEKLAQMKAENEKKREAYQTSLDKIEKDLTEVEEKFGETEVPPDEDETAT